MARRLVLAVCAGLATFAAAAHAEPANKSCWSDEEIRARIDSSLVADGVLGLAGSMTGQGGATRYCVGVDDLKSYPRCSRSDAMLKYYREQAAQMRCLVPRASTNYLTPQPVRDVNVEYYVLWVSAVCFGLALLASLVFGGWEILRAVARLFRRNDARLFRRAGAPLDGWALAGIVWVPLILAPFAFAAFATRLWGPLNGDPTLLNAAFAAAMLALVVSALVPLLVPLVRAYVHHRASVWPYVRSIGAVAAMPAALYFSFAAMAQFEQGAKTGTLDTVPATMFYLDDDVPVCTANLMGQLRLRGFTSFDDAQRNPDQVHAQFWVDTTLKAATLDALDIFGCGLSQIRHNQDSPLMAAVVFVYKLFVSTIVLGALLLPLAERLGRRKAGT